MWRTTESPLGEEMSISLKRPRSVRSERSMTASFKLRKVDLQRQGYDDKAFDDPLYVRDEAGATYVPYSAEALARAGLPPFA